MLVTEIDSLTLRSALGSFPTGVAVVTTFSKAEGGLGLTVSSFNSVSLSPPLVLFSIAKSARGFSEWRSSANYVVNILAEQHCELSRRFGRPGVDKWSGIDVERGRCGPVLAGALTSLHCEAYDHHDGGDHEIFVGRVVAIQGVRQHTDLPLLFYGGRYRRLERDDVAPSS